MCMIFLSYKKQPRILNQSIDSEYNTTILYGLESNSCYPSVLMKKLLNGYGYTSGHTGIKSSHTSRFCAEKSCILMYESLIHLLFLHSFLHVSQCSFSFFVIPKPNSFVGWLFEKGLELWRVHASGRFFWMRSPDQHCPGFNLKSLQTCLVYLQCLANLVGIFEKSLNVWIGINPFTGWNSKRNETLHPTWRLSDTTTICSRQTCW